LSSPKAIDPDRTHIYHITHIDNLPGIISAGGLMSDSRRRRGEFGCTNIGHMHIKDRRMHRPVPVAAGGVLGDYVPFNFCSRSVMLCAIYYNNVACYSGDQQPIIHLVSTVGEATRCGQPWAFTDRHAELGYARYYDNLAELSRVNWKVMPLRDWRGQETKETRQAEFLVHDFFAWPCVRWIGVHNSEAAEAVTSLLSQAPRPPRILVRPGWYYS
jgi:ssDNA thymidine ADP-ribosyltransferase, DarT